MRHQIAVVAVVWLAGTLAAPALAQDEEEKELGWFNTTELSLVAIGGNAESETFSLKAAATRVWESSDLTLSAGALRAESTTVTRTAVGTPNSFSLVEAEDTNLTAENYFFKSRYGRLVTDQLQWFGAAGWERNEFAGITNRYSLGGGVGHVWWQEDDKHFRTDYGLFWTQEEDLLGLEEDYLALRLSWDYLRPLTQTATFGSVLALDENVEETSDFRIDTTNWVSVAISDQLALRVSLQLLYDNEPSLVPVPLTTAGGVPTGNTVLAELDELDTILTVGLVVNF